MDIALGRRLPLTAYDSYYGPLFPYLIAGAFKIFGLELTVPRTVIMVFGALTAPATFWCGRVVCGRWAGAIAGSLVVTSPTLILHSSHYGWSNSLTPFFATLAADSSSVMTYGRKRRGSVQRPPSCQMGLAAFASPTCELASHPVLVGHLGVSLLNLLGIAPEFAS